MRWGGYSNRSGPWISRRVSATTDSYDALSGSSAAGGTRTTYGYPGMDEYEDGGHSPRAWGATTTVDRSAAGRE